jgi:hypothetical protein
MDDRIKWLLDQTGYHYQWSPGVGRWGLNFGLGTRSQMVFVDPAPDEMGVYRDFTIWSPVRDCPSDEEVMTALQAVGVGDLGGFLLRTYDDGAGVELIYSVDIPTDATPEAFEGALRVCTMTADAAERALGLDLF